MQVRFRNPAPGALPSAEAFYAAPQQTFLSMERTYEIHAVSVYDGVTFLQVIDDLETPVFIPRALFEVLDPRISADWICNVFPDGLVQMVLGPPHVAKDVDAYNAMVDHDAAQVELLWRRLKAAKREPDSAED